MVPHRELLALDLPCDEHAPAAVRQALSAAPAGSWALGDAMLIASELVTNAVLHSDCGGEHDIQVRVELADDHLVIDVVDPGLSGREARVQGGSPFGGYGLQLVDQLARNWGAERDHGYRVWAEVSIAGAG